MLKNLFIFSYIANKYLHFSYKFKPKFLVEFCSSQKFLTFCWRSAKSGACWTQISARNGLLVICTKVQALPTLQSNDLAICYDDRFVSEIPMDLNVALFVPSSFVCLKKKG